MGYYRPNTESYEDFSRFAFQIVLDFHHSINDNPTQADLYRCYVVKEVLRMFSGIPFEKIAHIEKDLGIEIPNFGDWIIRDIHKLSDGENAAWEKPSKDNDK